MKNDDKSAEGDWCPSGSVAHKCRVPSSFPLLLIFQQRLSLDEEEVKCDPYMKPEVGYQKPSNIPSSYKISFGDLLKLYRQDGNGREEQKDYYMSQPPPMEKLIFKEQFTPK